MGSVEAGVDLDRVEDAGVPLEVRTGARETICMLAANAPPGNARWI
jgi:hypothetical protein